MKSILIDIALNQVSQQVLSKEEVIDWFNAQVYVDQRQILSELVFLTLQSGVIGEDVEKAIAWANLRPTLTPCVMMLTAAKLNPKGSSAISSQAYRLLDLPEAEMRKSFLLLLGLFCVGVNRHRTRAFNPTKYWWHRDLSDHHVVTKVIQEFEKHVD